MKMKPKKVWLLKSSSSSSSFGLQLITGILGFVFFFLNWILFQYGPNDDDGGRGSFASTFCWGSNPSNGTTTASERTKKQFLEGLYEDGGNSNRFSIVKTNGRPEEEQLSNNNREDDNDSNDDDNENDNNDDSNNDNDDENDTNQLSSTTTTTEGLEHYHIIFSTGCDIKQDWQSYMLFYHAMKVQQPGSVTRIASGCSDQKALELRQYHKEHIEIMSNRFYLHLTPNYATLKGKGKLYKYFNKPFGVRHWMEHQLNYRPPSNNNNNNNNTTTTTTTTTITTTRMDPNFMHDDCIIILLDPDQILLRPITNDFHNMIVPKGLGIIQGQQQQQQQQQQPQQQQNEGPILNDEQFFTEKRKNHQDLVGKVMEGYPFAQLYGYHSDWLRQTVPNISYILSQDEDPSTIIQINNDRMHRYFENYSIGPPYILTAKDMYRLVLKWTEYVPKIYDVYPKLLAEMYAYSVAAAQVNLPHQVVQGFMVSNPDIQKEGWNVIDDYLSDIDVCSYNFTDSHSYLPASLLHHNNNNNNNNNQQQPQQPQQQQQVLIDQFPPILHYCLRYVMGKFFINKYKLPKNFFSCQFPLLKVPPENLVSLYNYGYYMTGEKHKYKTKTIRKRHAFMVCTLIKALNNAATFYKQHHCMGNDQPSPNMEESFIFFKNMNIPPDEDEFQDQPQ